MNSFLDHPPDTLAIVGMHDLIGERPRPLLRREADEPLEAGTTICIEPGIPFPGAGTMKLEDDLVVTEAGYELLTFSGRSLS